MLDYLKINADTAIKILSIIITAITTYFVTKYTANRPRKLEIKDLQFKTVYLPIYKLLYNDLNKRINKDTALKYANEIKIILSNNFELAFPQLHTLNDSFLEAITSNGDYQSLFYKICYQVNLDYELLKQALGYPSQTSFSIFKRMSRKDKLKEILGWCCIIQMFSSILLIVILSNTISKIKLVKFMIINGIIFFYLLYLNSKVRSMEY